MLAVGSTYVLKTTYANYSKTPKKVFYTREMKTKDNHKLFLEYRFSHAINFN